MTQLRVSSQPVSFHLTQPGQTTRAASALMLVCACLTHNALAQQSTNTNSPPIPQQDTDIYQNRPIRSIQILKPDPDNPASYIPLDPSLEQLIRNQIRSTPGSAYNHQLISQDIARVNRLGRFAKIESRVQLLDDGSVQLTYVVVEQPLIQDVQTVGNRTVSDQDIAAVVPLLAGTPVDPFQLDRASRLIEALYRSKGYYLAEVAIDEKELEETGIVLFRIREGERVKITRIQFKGNDTFTASKIRSVLKTKPANLLFNKGAMDNDLLREDDTNIVNFYKDRGYLDIRTDHSLIISPNGKEAIVTFLVDEGPVYTLQTVSILYPPDLDNAILSEQQTIGLMAIKPGDVYSVNLLDKSIASIRSALTKIGYIDAQVNRREARNLRSPFVQLVLSINPGKRYRTGQIIISGNTVTRQDVIRRNIEIKPDRPLDQSAIDLTKKRLQSTRLFEPGPNGVSIAVQPPDPEDPIYRDVLLQVTETNTGSFNFGASVGSDSGVIGQISLTQRNFDIADTPDSFSELLSGKAFRGGGQTFSIDLLPGNDFQTYSISLAEPSLLGSDYSISSSIFYRSSVFDNFDETRLGSRTRLGRAFGTRWSGGLALRAESIDLGSISGDRPTEIHDFKGASTLYGVGFQLVRTSVDNRYRPSRGSRIELELEQITGDYNFTKIRAQHVVFLPLYEDFFNRATTLSLNTRINYTPQDSEEVPVFERYYQGGQNFRGFDFRTVSPKGIRFDNGLPTDEEVGGTWSFFWGVEVQQPLFQETISVVGFLDTGTVTKEIGFDEYRASVGVGLRVFIPQLSPAPLGFDIAVPILKQDGDKDRFFSFFVDLPF